MPKYMLDYLNRFETHLRLTAGQEAARQVLVGKEYITERSSPVRVAQFMKGAIERMDSVMSKEEKERVMAGCGADCAHANSQSIQQARQRRLKAASLSDFLIAESQQPVTGARLTWNGEMLLIAYTPYESGRPARCYCPLFKGLPNTETLPGSTEAISGCAACARAFTQTTWEAILDRPVQVKLVSSCLMGQPECMFELRFALN
jgi:hypothetical protein